MYILINLDSMKFVHKHDSASTLLDIVQIELRNTSIHVVPCDAIGVGLSLVDIGALYRNYSTANPLPSRAGMCEFLRKIADEFPVSDIDSAEAKVQADSIPDESTETYTYVKGAYKAAHPYALFTTTASPKVTSTQPQSRAQRSTQPVQRVQGAKALIWEVADKMWNDAGNPTSKVVVLKLRKDMMGVLEGQGVKRTSSSNELGNWQKVRIANLSD